MVFSDDDFLPITFDFQTSACLGYQQAEISVPSGAPNGIVTVLWYPANSGLSETQTLIVTHSRQCSGGGARSCSRASIAGGGGNSDALELHQRGTMECLVPTATFTTFSTITSGSSTILEDAVSTLFSNSSVDDNPWGVSVTSSSSSSAVDVGVFATLPSSATVSMTGSSLSSPTRSASAAALLATTTMDIAVKQCPCSLGATKSVA